MLQTKESLPLNLQLVPRIAMSLLFAATVCGLASCGHSEDKAADAIAAKTSEFDEERCYSLVASGMEGLRPTRLTIDSELPTALATLNQWMKECGKSETAARTSAPNRSNC